MGHRGKWRRCIPLVCLWWESKAFNLSSTGLDGCYGVGPLLGTPSCGRYFSFPGEQFRREVVLHLKNEGDVIDPDPFRPERASISPVVINALVPVLFSEV